MVIAIVVRAAALWRLALLLTAFPMSWFLIVAGDPARDGGGFQRPDEIVCGHGRRLQALSCQSPSRERSRTSAAPWIWQTRDSLRPSTAPTSFNVSSSS